MQALGLRPPQTFSMGGLMTVKPLSRMLHEEAQAAKNRASEAANQPMVQGLVAHINKHWSLAKQAKLPIEQQMLRAVRSRRGEYDPEKLAQIKQQGGSEIYMMLFATKSRQLKALLTDILVGTGTEKPWSISPTPKPDLPPGDVTQIMQGIHAQVQQAEMSGMPMDIPTIRGLLRDAKAAAINQIMEQARTYAEAAEADIEDAMVQGGWLEAFDQFLDDLTTFKTAFMKGPVVRMAPRLAWVQGQDGRPTPQTTIKKVLEWERVDPFMIYPAPWSKGTDDAFLIERHRLSRATLSAMIGTDGYSEDAIRSVLDEHGIGGLHEWLAIDVQKATAEGRNTAGASVHQQSDLIDALQYWGSVSGKMLIEWGMTAEEIPDTAKEYEVEAWLIGGHCIKAVLNPDPLFRRPYYSDGFSRIPGAFWHNSLFDVTSDCQDMCNGAARALANNLGIASGPLVVWNIDRLPQGAEITQLYPWQIMQTISDPMGSSAAPVSFYQPSSNAAELMSVFEKYSQLADEYAGIPKYMAGLSGGEGGAGRTASGMSMMITNAGKQIKQTLASIDLHLIDPSVERTYHWMLQYGDNPDMKGDLEIRARGAMSLVAKESAQVRRNEFLAQTNNPTDQAIIGLEGRAEILRQTVKTLDLNSDKIVPPESVVKAKAFAIQQQQQQAAQQQMEMAQGQQQANPKGNGQALIGGGPVTDNFSPTPAPG